MIKLALSARIADMFVHRNTRFLFFLALLTACQPATRQTPDDTLVVLVDAVHRDLDPRFALTSHDTKLSRLIAPGLTTVNTSDLKPKLELARTLKPISELLWEVKLRDDLRFSTGQKLSADDVVYTYESVMGDSVDSVYRKSFNTRYERIEAVDELTIRFHLHKPLATIRSDLDFGIISKKAALAGEGVFPTGRVIGSGVYQVESFEEEDVRLARNPHYYGAQAKTPKVRLRTVRDANARNLMMVGGSADLTQNSVRADLIDYVAKNKRIQVVQGKSSALSYMMMNNVDPILDDPRVRHAIAHGINRQKIVDRKISKRAVLATGLLPPGHWAYKEPTLVYDYDPERAKELLDQAGFPDPDGPGGEPRMRLSYKTSTNQFRLAIARVIASQLAEIGIDVDVRSFEFGTFFADIKKGNFQLGTMDTSPISEPDYYYTYFHSERIPTEANPHLHNRWRYQNERVDELTILGRQTPDLDERKTIYTEVQEILARDLPVYPLWHLDNIAVMNTDLSGYRVLPNASFAALPDVQKR